ncbi:GNAT family N-acetyltransferase [Grimontia marina]|uniref:Ribosomal-protein-S5-alanine N-acetyltransferase n=1 Tax=Grimontia marina TaxID=646534 RepID=A0A128FKA9_9GAMM|nr:GNAT family N-acetyltransferase [Grimontia marina]CZF86676.1 ribosomal-protein-S5-alanine N-acetyltransferase [Grimontia marina]
MKPVLSSHRLVLRSIVHSDVDDLFEIYGNEQVMEFASDPVFTSIEMVHQMLESVARLEATEESFEWAIVEKASNKVIGTCGLHSFNQARSECEVGCLLHPAYWNKGFMSEALPLLFEHAETMGIQQLRADIDQHNVRSQRLFRKLGFKAYQSCYVLGFSKEVASFPHTRNNAT